MIRIETEGVLLTETDDSETLIVGCAEITVTRLDDRVTVKVTPRGFSDYYPAAQVEVTFEQLKQQATEIIAANLTMLESKLI